MFRNFSNHTNTSRIPAQNSPLQALSIEQALPRPTLGSIFRGATERDVGRTTCRFSFGHRSDTQLSGRYAKGQNGNNDYGMYATEKLS
jgi:hypothetical protein